MKTVFGQLSRGPTDNITYLATLRKASAVSVLLKESGMLSESEQTVLLYWALQLATPIWLGFV